MNNLIRALLFSALFLLAPSLARAQITAPGGYNGFGSCTRPSGSLSYGAGAITKLFGCQSGGSLAPMTITVAGSVPGANLITGARLYSNGTGASGAQFKVHLYYGTPTLAGLADASTYIGPYAADQTNYIGTLTCASMTPTNDNTPTYWTECSIGNLINQSLRFTSNNGGNAQLFGVVEVTNGYTAISQEQLNLSLSTIPVS